MINPRPNRHDEKYSDEAIQKTATGLPRFRWSLMAAVIVFLVFQISAAEACMFWSPTLIENPEQVIEQAYFIGVVEILSVVRDRTELKAEVMPIQAYKIAEGFRKEKLAVVFDEYDRTMCEANAYLSERSESQYMEAVILESEKGKWRWFRRSPKYSMTTRSLGKHWEYLRQNSNEAGKLKHIEESCINDGREWGWRFTEIDSTSTNGFSCRTLSGRSQ